MWWFNFFCLNYRRKLLTLLRVFLACFLLLCLELYAGTIQRNKMALDQVGKELPVEVTVVSTDGTQDVGIRIEESKIEGLLATGIKAPVYSTQIAGNIDPVNQLDPVKSCDTSLYGINTLDGFSFLENDSVTFASGFDKTFVESQDPVCVLSTNYAITHNLQVGDNLTLPVYSIDYDQTGYSFQFGSLGTVSLEVIGTFEEASGGQSTVNGIVPIAWVRTLYENNELPFFYHSFNGVVNNPLELNSFKVAVEELGFREVNPTAADLRTGNALIIHDKVFRETAERLQGNLRLFKLFMPGFCVLLCALVLVITFFVLRSSRKNIALAYAFGKPLVLLGFTLLLDNLLLSLIGCGIALAISLPLLGTMALPVAEVFVAVSFFGSVGAVFLVCRIDVLQTLIKQEETM